jgi:hypothetical protein
MTAVSSATSGVRHDGSPATYWTSSELNAVTFSAASIRVCSQKAVASARVISPATSWFMASMCSCHCSREAAAVFRGASCAAQADRHSRAAESMTA